MGITAGSSFTSVDDTSLVALAESGLGFCIMGWLMLKSLTSNIRAFSFDPPQYRHLALLRSSRVAASPAVWALSGHIADYVRSLPAFTCRFRCADPTPDGGVC